MKLAHTYTQTPFKLTFLAFISPLLLAACSTVGPTAQTAEAPANQWYSPLPASTSTQTNTAMPHQGSLQALNAWWQSLGDPLLVELINSAQTVSPTISAAASRLAQARSSSVSADSALLPKAGLSAGSTRSMNPLSVPVLSTISQVGLQASWELDLFGGNRAARDAALARVDGSAALWHEARVSVAAEVAATYLNLRTCTQLLAVAQEDLASRTETSRLTSLTADAGFTAPANAALARASAAQGQNSVSLQRTQCEMNIKALVALTALQEPDLKNKLTSAGVNIDFIAIKSIANSKPTADPITPAMPMIPSVPAQLLSQRPDVYAAERDVAAASGDVGSAQAARYPRLGLSGSIAAARLVTGGVSTDGNTWSIGPLSLSLPLFDGGQLAANVEAAQARYADAATSYRAKVRSAVREVEEALLNLQSTAERSDAAKIATEGYSAAFNASEARYKSGLGSLADLEDTRRTALAAKTALLNLQRERSAAWIALYRATGGGWQQASSTVAPKTP